MKRFLAAIAVATIAASPLSAQVPQCQPLEHMEAAFAAREISMFREMTLPWGGVTATAQLWLAPNGEWGLILVGNGMGCMLLSGTDFRLPPGSL